MTASPATRVTLLLIAVIGAAFLAVTAGGGRGEPPTSGGWHPARRVSLDPPSTEELMDVGLNLFYKRGDANGAVNEFRKVLEQNPTHYGATMQLAKALDYAGRHAEAKPYWQRMAAMADSIHDSKTLDTAQARLRRVW